MHAVERLGGARRVSRADYGIAGCGRAGTALAVALARRGKQVLLWDRRPARSRQAARAAAAEATKDLHRLVGGSAALVLAVQDDAIAPLATAIAAAWPERHPPRAVLHLAGALSSRALVPAARRGAATGVCQPAIALHGAVSAGELTGAWATVSGASREGLAAARRLARAGGMRPITIEDRSRPLAHLAMVLAAGDLVALLSLSTDLLHQAGVPLRPAREIASRLAAGVISRFESHGVERSLTGPASRGDAGTLVRHAAALRDARASRSAAAAAHRVLALAGAETAYRAGLIPAAALKRIRRALDDSTPPAVSRNVPPGALAR